jgi:hypothetical protein
VDTLNEAIVEALGSPDSVKWVMDSFR